MCLEIMFNIYIYRIWFIEIDYHNTSGERKNKSDFRLNQNPVLSVVSFYN